GRGAPPKRRHCRRARLDRRGSPRRGARARVDPRDAEPLARAVRARGSRSGAVRRADGCVRDRRPRHGARARRERTLRAAGGWRLGIRRGARVPPSGSRAAGRALGGRDGCRGAILDRRARGIAHPRSGRMAIVWHLLTGEYPANPSNREPFEPCGGVGDYTASLADALAAEGDAVHVWVPRASGSARRGVTVHALPPPFARPPTPPPPRASPAP